MIKHSSSKSPKYYKSENKKLFKSKAHVIESPKTSVYCTSSRNRSASPYNRRLILSEEKVRSIKIISSPLQRNDDLSISNSGQILNRYRSSESSYPAIYINGESIKDLDDPYSYSGLTQLNDKLLELFKQKSIASSANSKNFYLECKKVFQELINKVEPLSGILNSLNSGYDSFIERSESIINDQNQIINDLNQKINRQMIIHREVPTSDSEKKLGLPERIVRENINLGKKITELEARLCKMMKRDKQYEKLIQVLNLHGVPVSLIYKTEIKNKADKEEKSYKEIDCEYNKDFVPKLNLPKSNDKDYRHLIADNSKLQINHEMIIEKESSFAKPQQSNLS